MFQLLVPRFVLFHSCQLVFQQFYVFHRGLEYRAFIRPNVSNDFVIPETKQPAMNRCCRLLRISIRSLSFFFFFLRRNFLPLHAPQATIHAEISKQISSKMQNRSSSRRWNREGFNKLKNGISKRIYRRFSIFQFSIRRIIRVRFVCEFRKRI